MNSRYLTYTAAFHRMIGRCQMSRSAGNLRRAYIQALAASRLYSLATKAAIADLCPSKP
jgi:hypothetical protein